MKIDAPPAKMSSGWIFGRQASMHAELIAIAQDSKPPPPICRIETMPGHKVSSAAKPGKAGKASVGGVAPAFSGASGGGYYSSITNPRFGYVPELGYSNALSFRIYPNSD
jgi:hypothetical protein